jgi:hypothetical protein
MVSFFREIKGNLILTVKYSPRCKRQNITIKTSNWEKF